MTPAEFREEINELVNQLKSGCDYGAGMAIECLMLNYGMVYAAAYPKAEQIKKADRTRTFPVLNQQHCRRSEQKEMPATVPWEFVETFRKQAESNHSQTLERLAERGGLAPNEMWYAAHGTHFFKSKKIGEQESIDWLVAAVVKFVEQ